MSLQLRLTDFITAIGTDIKLLRTYITGSSTGDLSGLTTTAKSSVIAAINEVKASATGAPPAATETQAGVIPIATQVETGGGAVDTKAVTPLKLRVEGDSRWQAKNANLTSLSGFTVSTAQALGTSDTILPTQAAVKAYADGIIDANNAFKYKGAIDASANPNYPAGNAGDVYKISAAGRIGGAAGTVVEQGDTVTLLVDGSAAGNQATVGANWLVTQTNIDGAVVGPATSVAANLPTFSGTTGKVIQDSGVAVSVDGTMAANVNTKVPTEAAVRTFLASNYYTQTQIGNPETDLVAAYNIAKA